MNVWECFQQALVVATAKTDKRDFLIGALAIRSDGVRVASANGPVMINGINQKSFYKKSHAEYRVCKKIDKGAIVFVVHISKSDGSFKLAKPCAVCQIVMRSKYVSKVYYTISDSEYGVMIL